MSFWVLVQIFVNLILLAAVAILWVRLSRPAKGDPRMSKGLQLLQSKISVLEDLSDKTESQSTQIMSLMEQKLKEIQDNIIKADRQVQIIEASMGKSLEVAKIFQDKIPHQEIIERQNTIKYVKAARMAHRGATVDEIAQQVDLSRGELEFIAKVNRDQLQFAEEELPAWAKEEEAVESSVDDFQTVIHGLKQDIVEQPIMQSQKMQTDRIKKAETLADLGEQFRQAMQSNGQPSEQLSMQPAVQLSTSASAVQILQPKPIVKVTNSKTNTKNNSGGVKKVVFPKIDVNSNLG